jgi:branched-chain amino acid transport system permease protein
MNRRAKFIRVSGYSAGVIILFLIPLFIKGPYTLHILTQVGINIILASSLRLINTSGQISLGHGGMMLIGAYTSTLLVMKLGLSSWAAFVLAGLVAGGFAFLVGFPLVRLKGIYFAMATVFLAQIIILTTMQWRSLTGGSGGIVNIPRPDPILILGLLNIDFASKVDFFYFILVLTLLSLLVIYAIERSRIGLTWLAIQQNNSLTESIGVNTAALKVLGFSIGSFFAGIAGAFYSQYMGVIYPSNFGFIFAIYIVIYMIVGGVRSFYGPILGAFLLTLLPELLSDLQRYQPFVFVAILMLIIFFLPDGLIDLPRRLKRLFTRGFTHA